MKRVRCWTNHSEQTARRVIPKGGYRNDLGIYVRSLWEANYARYLNWLKTGGMISRWDYEPETFEFYKIKKGTRFYTPDFRVELPNGKVEYHEVKGYMRPEARTALRRMARYYPHIKIVLIDKHYYESIRKNARRLIPGWEE